MVDELVDVARSRRRYSGRYFCFTFGGTSTIGLRSWYSHGWRNYKHSCFRWYLARRWFLPEDPEYRRRRRQSTGRVCARRSKRRCQRSWVTRLRHSCNGWSNACIRHGSGDLLRTAGRARRCRRCGRHLWHVRDSARVFHSWYCRNSSDVLLAYAFRGIRPSSRHLVGHRYRRLCGRSGARSRGTHLCYGRNDGHRVFSS